VPRQGSAVPEDDLEGDWISPPAVAALLAARGVQSLLMEGGPILAGSWWSAGLVDQVVAFIAPRLVSGAVCRSPLRGTGVPAMVQATALREVQIRTLGADSCLSGYVTEAY
jgi:diaminohydroxyphosphoribosylaminopyrimidine deaminase/5-amino-6-(5-phosphoribosylamino)uracil reductase